MLHFSNLGSVKLLSFLLDLFQKLGVVLPPLTSQALAFLFQIPLVAQVVDLTGPEPQNVGSAHDNSRVQHGLDRGQSDATLPCGVRHRRKASTCDGPAPSKDLLQSRPQLCFLLEFVHLAFGVSVEVAQELGVGVVDGKHDVLVGAVGRPVAFLQLGVAKVRYFFGP